MTSLAQCDQLDPKMLKHFILHVVFKILADKVVTFFSSYKFVSQNISSLNYMWIGDHICGIVSIKLKVTV